MDSKGLQKVTVYYQSPEWGGPVKKLEGKIVEHGTKKYAQYNDSPYVVLFPKRKKRARILNIFGSDPYLLILKGWGQPEPPSPWETERDAGNGVTVQKMRHAMVCGPWCEEMNAFINPILESLPSEVLADYRVNKTP